jgi:hypothetical protein
MGMSNDAPLPIYVTKQQLAHYTNCDPRSLPRELLHVVAKIMIGNQLRDLYYFPRLTYAATKVVNSATALSHAK